jgi:hypothetical protein
MTKIIGHRVEANPLMQPTYEVRARVDGNGADLVSEHLPFGRLWYSGDDAIENAVSYAEFYSRSHAAVIRVFDASGGLLTEYQHAGEFHDWWPLTD